MLFSRPLGLVVMLGLLLVGNLYGFGMLSLKPQEFLNQFPTLTSKSLLWIKVMQALNVVSIIGIWYWQQWAVWFGLALVCAVLILDIYYGIHYHIAVVLITSTLTAWFIIRNWASFV